MKFLNTESKEVVEIDVRDDNTGVFFTEYWINTEDYDYDEDNDQYEVSGAELAYLISYAEEGYKNEDGEYKQNATVFIERGDDCKKIYYNGETLIAEKY